MKSTRLFIFPSLTILLTSLTLLFGAAVQAQVPSYVPTNGLVGWWPFNGNANDESGNGNDGTVNLGTSGTALYSIDRNGNAESSMILSSNPSWNSLGPYIEILGTNSLSLLSYSFTIWIKPSANCLAGELINKGPDNSGIFSRLQGLAGIAFGSVPNYVDYTYDVSSEEWTMLTFNKNDNSISELYINGVMVYSMPSSIQSNNNFNLVFGAMSSGGTNGSYYPYQGLLDDIGIWNRALTADEVLALYNGCNLTAQVIAGNITPGAFSNSTYTCNNNAGSTYAWTVNNGVIVSGQGTNSVTILWGAEGVGSVTVAETTADGCVGDAVVYDVNVQCVVSGNEIIGPVGPEAFSSSTYTCNGAANSTYNWTVTNGVIASGQGTNTVDILWASTGLGNVSVIETTAEGCVGTTLSQDVVVIPTNVEELSNALILYPNPVTTELNLQTTSDLIGTDLFVFDALGKQILKQQILSTNTIINTSSFAAGNYVVKVGGGVKKFEVVR